MALAGEGEGFDWDARIRMAPGLIEGIRADSRVRVSKDGRTAMPWGGRFWRYERRDGMLVPLEGEVAWLPAGEAAMPYWRGSLVDVTYDVAR